MQLCFSAHQLRDHPQSRRLNRHDLKLMYTCCLHVTNYWSIGFLSLRRRQPSTFSELGILIRTEELCYVRCVRIAAMCSLHQRLSKNLRLNLDLVCGVSMWTSPAAVSLQKL